MWVAVQDRSVLPPCALSRARNIVFSESVEPCSCLRAIHFYSNHRSPPPTAFTSRIPSDRQSPELHGIQIAVQESIREQRSDSGEKFDRLIGGEAGDGAGDGAEDGELTFPGRRSFRVEATEAHRFFCTTRTRGQTLFRTRQGNRISASRFLVPSSLCTVNALRIP